MSWVASYVTALAICGAAFGVGYWFALSFIVPTVTKMLVLP